MKTMNQFLEKALSEVNEKNRPKPKKGQTCPHCGKKGVGKRHIENCNKEGPNYYRMESTEVNEQGRQSGPVNKVADSMARLILGDYNIALRDLKKQLPLNVDFEVKDAGRFNDAYERLYVKIRNAIVEAITML